MKEKTEGEKMFIKIVDQFQYEADLDWELEFDREGFSSTINFMTNLYNRFNHDDDVVEM